MADCLIQYVLIRGDLSKSLQWPSGAIIAQACHACCAVLHLYYNDPSTQAYLKDLDNMHKVVLEVESEESLRKLEVTFKENNVCHKMWLEQPENIPTCIALKPYPKAEIKKYINKLRLLKN